MIKILKVKGLASGKILKTFEITSATSLNITLLEFLRSNSITIASSCNGEGTCKKCIVNGQIVSCQITLKNFIKEADVTFVEVSYL